MKLTMTIEKDNKKFYLFETTLFEQIITHKKLYISVIQYDDECYTHIMDNDEKIVSMFLNFLKEEKNEKK